MSPPPQDPWNDASLSCSPYQVSTFDKYEQNQRKKGLSGRNEVLEARSELEFYLFIYFFELEF